jgi:hypothetical protein
MTDLFIEATEFGPRIEMKNTGKICISGKSMLEDASSFFSPCFEWVKDFSLHTEDFLIIEIELSYFNSSSAKQILKLLMIVDELTVGSKVCWISPPDNDVLLERGQELEIMLDLPFEFRSN